jgi:hypothetical protein
MRRLDDVGEIRQVPLPQIHLLQTYGLVSAKCSWEAILCGGSNRVSTPAALYFHDEGDAILTDSDLSNRDDDESEGPVGEERQPCSRMVVQRILNM